MRSLTSFDIRSQQHSFTHTSTLMLSYQLSSSFSLSHKLSCSFTYFHGGHQLHMPSRQLSYVLIYQREHQLSLSFIRSFMNSQALSHQFSAYPLIDSHALILTLSWFLLRFTWLSLAFINSHTLFSLSSTFMRSLDPLRSQIWCSKLESLSSELWCAYIPCGCCAKRKIYFWLRSKWTKENWTEGNRYWFLCLWTSKFKILSEWDFSYHQVFG